MDQKLILAVSLLLVSATVIADYVRPPPRKTLSLPWDPKPASYPQQVTLASSLFQLRYFDGPISGILMHVCDPGRILLRGPFGLCLFPPMIVFFFFSCVRFIVYV